MIYENERTTSLIRRLVSLAPLLRAATMAVWVVLMAALFTLVGATLQKELWWLTGLLGAILGYAMGGVFGSFMVLTVEWMAQLLAAQGEIRSAVAKK